MMENIENPLSPKDSEPKDSIAFMAFITNKTHSHVLKKPGIGVLFLSLLLSDCSMLLMIIYLILTGLNSQNFGMTRIIVAEGEDGLVVSVSVRINQAVEGMDFNRRPDRSWFIPLMAKVGERRVESGARP